MNEPLNPDGIPFEVNVFLDSSRETLSNPTKENPKPQKIRLGCIHCDRCDCDGIDEIPGDWKEVFPVQDWQSSIEPVQFDDMSGRSAIAWETHLGICPECYAEFDREELPSKQTLKWKNSESTDSEDQEVEEKFDVHPIIRQIIDRDCHVAESNRNVVRHVVSKLRYGYESLRAMSKADRRKFIEQCVVHHRRNYKEYVEVMSGFRYTTQGKGTAERDITTLPGVEIVKLMRKHKMTIEQLAFRLGTSQKRVRQVRDKGLLDTLAIRDWIQAITGKDVGPIPKKYRIHNKQEEGDCQFCGYPLYVGDPAFEYVGEMFCSITCSRKSRGW